MQTESRSLEKKPTVSFEKLLDAAALGTTEPAALESLAGRLIRLERRFDPELEAQVVQTAKGQNLSQIAKRILDALDPDEILAQAKPGKPAYVQPTEKEIRAIREIRSKHALAPLATNPDLRDLLKKIHQASEQTIDVISQDTLLYAGPAQKTAHDGAQTAKSFRQYIEQHKAEITALQLLYSRPYKQRLTEAMLKELETRLKPEFGPHPVDTLWHAYELTADSADSTDAEKKKSALSAQSVVKKNPTCRFADLVALVRFALEQQPVLEPFAESVTTRFNEWLMDKAKASVTFTLDQLAWLQLIRDHIATSLSTSKARTKTTRSGPLCQCRRSTSPATLYASGPAWRKLAV